MQYFNERERVKMKKIAMFLAMMPTSIWLQLGILVINLLCWLSIMLRI